LTCHKPPKKNKKELKRITHRGLLKVAANVAALTDVSPGLEKYAIIAL
jgi:hypothetical protein